MNVYADLIILLEQKTHHIDTARTTDSQQPLSVVSPLAIFCVTVTPLLIPYAFSRVLSGLP